MNICKTTKPYITNKPSYHQQVSYITNKPSYHHKAIISPSILISKQKATYHHQPSYQSKEKRKRHINQKKKGRGIPTKTKRKRHINHKKAQRSPSKKQKVIYQNKITKIKTKKKNDISTQKNQKTKQKSHLKLDLTTWKCNGSTCHSQETIPQ